jgi:hypothetical protein
MRPASRVEYAWFALAAVLNLLGTFYMMMGAAFNTKGSNLIVAILLFAGVILVFMFDSARRALDAGWHPAVGAGGVILLAGTGPGLLLFILVLLIKQPKPLAADSLPQTRSGWSVALGCLWRVVWPWSLFWFSLNVNK